MKTDRTALVEAVRVDDPKTKEIIKRLDRSFRRSIRLCNYSDHAQCWEFQQSRSMKGWEIFFFPEEMYYQETLDTLTPEDVVFDVGAGDLRFDLIMASKVKKVYAIEINPELVQHALKIIGYDLPRNLTAICGNAFDWPVLPNDVTVITCLMKQRVTPFPGLWHSKRIIYANNEGLVYHEGEIHNG